MIALTIGLTNASRFGWFRIVKDPRRSNCAPDGVLAKQGFDLGGCRLCSDPELFEQSASRG